MSKNKTWTNLNSAVTIITNEYKTKMLFQEYDNTYPRVNMRGKFNLFGGNIENFETPQDAIKRELLEEINNYNLLNNINSSLIKLGNFYASYFIDDVLYSIDENVFLSVLKNDFFDTLSNDVNYSNEGTSRVISINSDIINNTTWTTPYILQKYLNLKIIPKNEYVFKRIYNDFLPDEKILNKEQLLSLSSISEEIIYCPGCFDLLHLGHMNFLRLIKTDNPNKILVVGVGRDKVIKELKGNDRPYLDEKTRMLQLSNLPYVDYVVLNDDVIYDREIDFTDVSNVLKPDYLIIAVDNKNPKVNLNFCEKNNIKPLYPRRDFETDNLTSTNIAKKFIMK